MKVSFTVYVKPQPQGSTRWFIPKGWTRPIITTDNKNLKPYRQQVAETAFSYCGEPLARHVPARLTLRFYLERPPSIPKKRTHHVVKPDLDKLIRSTGDALKGIAYHDDGQIVSLACEKFYGTPERVEITIETVT